MKSKKIHIKVIGVGCGGGNAINHIAQLNKGDAQFIVVNTDRKALNDLNVEEKIQIGQCLTNGYGSSANPDIGKKAAEDDYEKICILVAGTDIIFLAAGLGGGTGTGATPTIAKAAKDAGALIIAIVTLPFTAEGTRRADIAKKGLDKLKQTVDFIICVPNDKIAKLCKNDISITIKKAFRLSDKVLNNAFTVVTNFIDKKGAENIDYNDVITVLKENVHF